MRSSSSRPAVRPIMTPSWSTVVSAMCASPAERVLSLHAELVPNLANLFPEAAQLSYDKGNKYSVP
ncbi:hypothetical protein ACWEPN_40285, partial [Nonomuraea wenchangensis]